MRPTSLALAGLAAGMLASTVPIVASAQSRAGAPAASATVFEATPYVGYIVFGDYLSGPLGTSLSNAPAAVYGAQLGMKLAPNLSIIGNLATATSDLQAGIPFLGGVSVAHSSVVLYDAGLQLDFPLTTMMGTNLSPFVQAGAGAMRYEITQSFITTHSTNFAANVGAGADIALGRGVGLRLMAKDYIGKFDFQDATLVDVTTNTSQTFTLSAGLRLSF